MLLKKLTDFIAGVRRQPAPARRRIFVIVDAATAVFMGVMLWVLLRTPPKTGDKVAEIATGLFSFLVVIGGLAYTIMLGVELYNGLRTPQVYSVAVDSSGTYLGAVVGSDLMLIDLQQGAQLWSSARFTSNARRVAFLPHSLTVVTAGGTCRDAPSGFGASSAASLTHDQELSPFASGCLAFSPDGGYVVGARCGSTKVEVVLKETIPGAKRCKLGEQPAEVTAIVFAGPNGEMVVSGSADGSIIIWDVASRQCLARMIQTGGVTSLAVDPKGDWIASGTLQRYANLWDLAPIGEKIAEFRERVFNEWSIVARRAIDLPGEFQMVLQKPGWTPVVSRSPSRRVEAHAGAVHCVAFSPDGSLLATAGQDGIVRFWDHPGGAERSRLEAHAGAVNAICFSPDGQLLVSGGKDRTIRAWHLDSGKLAWCLAAHRVGWFGSTLRPG
jgi:WD40 repeat protein